MQSTTNAAALTCCDGSPIIEIVGDVIPFPSLTAGLLADGWREGPPADMDAVALAVDVECWADAACGACGRVGLDVIPFHRGRSYGVVVRCPVCHFEEQA